MPVSALRNSSPNLGSPRLLPREPAEARMSPRLDAAETRRVGLSSSGVISAALAERERVTPSPSPPSVVVLRSPPARSLQRSLGSLCSRPKLSLSAAVRCMLAAEQRMWVGLADGKLILWDLQRDQLLESKQAFRNGAVTALMHVPNTNTVWSASAEEAVVRMWDAKVSVRVCE